MRSSLPTRRETLAEALRRELLRLGCALGVEVREAVAQAVDARLERERERPLRTIAPWARAVASAIAAPVPEGERSRVERLTRAERDRERGAS